MNKYENVINAFELCSLNNPYLCTKCPYQLQDMIDIDETQCFDVLIKDAIEILKEQQKTGHWIDQADSHTCSVCEAVTFVDRYVWIYDSYKYCPRCGAKLTIERNK